MKDYWDKDGKRDDDSGRSNRIFIIFLIMIACIALYMLAVEGYRAMTYEMNHQQIIAQRSALMKLKEPIDYSLPEHYLQMTGDSYD